VFLAAAAALGLPPGACVVLEDAAAGVQAGRAAGMRVVGVATTLSAAELEAEGADLVVGEVAELGVADVLGARYRQRRAAGAGAPR
jgi:beta-phosphoglucomutase-like phosphatase (HAD superfamily)